MWKLAGEISYICINVSVSYRRRACVSRLRGKINTRVLPAGSSRKLSKTYFLSRNIYIIVRPFLCNAEGIPNASNFAFVTLFFFSVLVNEGEGKITKQVKASGGT